MLKHFQVLKLYPTEQNNFKSCINFLILTVSLIKYRSKETGFRPFQNVYTTNQIIAIIFIYHRLQKLKIKQTLNRINTKPHFTFDKFHHT